MATFAERWMWWIDDMQAANTDVAAALGVTPGLIAQYKKGPGIKGGAAPTQQGLERIAVVTGLDLNWLTGFDTTSRWGPLVQRLRLILRVRAPRVMAPNVLTRIVRCIEIIQAESPLPRQEWWLAGMLGIPKSELPSFLQGEGDLPPHTLARFAEFSGLPDLWLELGEPELLTPPADLGDYTNLVLWFAEQGVTATELYRERERIKNYVYQFRGQLRQSEKPGD